MTSPCDSRSRPRCPKQPGLIHGCPGGLEHHENELEEASPQDSVLPPSANILRRDMESVHDLREASKQYNGRQSTPNPNPIYPSWSVSTARRVGRNTASTLSSPSTFFHEPCEKCSVLNVEDMAQPGGHKHSVLSELCESREWCGLCDLMATCLGVVRGKEFITDRYQIVLSICGTGYDTEIPESTHRGRPRSALAHGNSRTHTIASNPSQLWVDVIDLLPWEPPKDNIENVFGAAREMPRTFIAPDGLKLRTVGGMSLLCLTREHDPATEFGVECVREVGSSTSSSRSFEIAAGWLASCLSTETPPNLNLWRPRRDLYGYRPRRDFYVYRPPLPLYKTGGSKAIAADTCSEAVSLSAQEPLRLVEIIPYAMGKAPSIKLIHTDGHHYQYAALSYCWGKPQPGDSRPWQTKQATLESHFKGINRQHLPKTLQDAIFICERLHISHLWVDSLCIIQDSPSDWAAEAAKMSGIYLGSLLAIALSSSISAESGCFNQASKGFLDSDHLNMASIITDTRMKDGRRSLLRISKLAYADADRSFDNEVRNGVLSQRAWALQEHIMPQRTLYITSRQLMWECRHCRLSEDNYPQTQGDWLYPICHLDFSLDAAAVIEIWYKRVIQDYTQRQLTYEKDKLVALSALARETYLNRRIDYVAGLWRDCIVPGLLWMRRGPGRKSKTYSCPTWSWASQNSAVTYDNATPSGFAPMPSKSFPRVQDVSWHTKPENAFGDVISASVDLETTITLGTVLRDNTFNYSLHPWTRAQNCKQQTLVIPGHGQNGTLCAGAMMDDEDGGGQNVAVANMGHCLLLLAPPSLSSEEYRRVGFAFPDSFQSLPSRPRIRMDDITRGWTERTIRLV